MIYLYGVLYTYTNIDDILLKIEAYLPTSKGSKEGSRNSQFDLTIVNNGQEFNHFRISITHSGVTVHMPWRKF